MAKRHLIVTSVVVALSLTGCAHIRGWGHISILIGHEYGLAHRARAPEWFTREASKDR